MGFDPERYHRRSVRLRGYDYATPGAYFITICTFGRACLFADPCDDGVVLNGAGRIAEVAWRDLPAHFPNVELDAFVVMPNHVHGIVMLTERTPTRVPLPDESVRIDHSINAEPITNVGAQHAVPLPDESLRIDRSIEGKPTPNVGVQHAVPLPGDTRIAHFTRPSPGSISTIIRSYKAAVTAQINIYRATPNSPVWQRGFHEHIVRDEDSLNRIREYIARNPANWLNDRDHPRFLLPSP